MARLLTLLTIASLETTLVSLPILALTSFDLPWPFLLLVTLLGLAADAISLRLPPRLERPALAAGAALAVLLVLGRQFGGLLAALAAFFPGSPGLGLAYALTLIALFLYWRGTRVATRDSLSVSAIFGRGAVAMLVALLLGPLLSLGTPLGSAPVLAHIVGFISLGLLALALTHAEDDPASREKRLGWRWLLSLASAIAAVVLAGVLVVALLGGGAAIESAQNLLRLLILPFAIVGGIIAYLIVTLIGAPLANLLRAIFARLSLLQNVAPQQPEQMTNGRNDQGMFETVTRLANGATLLMALIPLALLVAAILLLRKRAQRARSEDEERESLGVASSLASDLRDLLGRLRNPFARQLVGLQAALAALAGDDPATRVRRAYVRFLLHLEARELARAPAQTPAELAVTMDAPQAATLTAAYERARYDPAGVAVADAEGAERDLAAIE